MRETDEDVTWLDELLRRSYETAGGHLTAIHTDPARVSAQDVVDLLTGMQLLVVATVSSDGRPFTGPVDGFLFRGRLHFGSSPDSLRARHLARCAQVSATHVRGEELVVTVHGRARELDIDGHDRGFAGLCREHYGQGWDEWAAGSRYWSIEPSRMFAADMSAHTAG